MNEVIRVIVAHGKLNKWMERMKRGRKEGVKGSKEGKNAQQEGK